MKRVDLIKHLSEHDCELMREGSRQSVYVNPIANHVTAVPRHREINDYLVRKICRDLEIPDPK